MRLEAQHCSILRNKNSWKVGLIHMSVELLSDMHWTLNIRNYPEGLWECELVTQLLRTLSGPASLLVKCQENVQVSPCEIMAGYCPKNSLQAGSIDDVSKMIQTQMGWKQKNIKNSEWTRGTTHKGDAEENDNMERQRDVRDFGDGDFVWSGQSPAAFFVRSVRDKDKSDQCPSFDCTIMSQLFL